MRVNLLHPERDSDWRWALASAELRDFDRTGRRYHGELFPDHSQGLPWNADALIHDLQLETLLSAMAGEDDCIYVVVRKELLTGAANDEAAIRYRQEVFVDCLASPVIIRAMHGAAVDALREDRRHYLGSYERSSADATLRWARELIEALLGPLQRLSDLATTAKVQSPGLRRFIEMLRSELPADYLASLRLHLGNLKFQDVKLMSAGLGPGNQGAGYVLHLAHHRHESIWAKLLRWLIPERFQRKEGAYSFAIAPSDENGHRALRELANRGLAAAALPLAQSAMQIRDFFASLRVELAFYVGCLNLHDQLTSKGEPMRRPKPVDSGSERLTIRGLYDPCLSLRRQERLVGNDADADQRRLIIITGANEGGNSTFLRSLGVAQLMMQAGMFVPAQTFQSSLCPALFTHFRREEDAAMRKGKFEEELGRMSAIVDHIAPGAWLLCNEGFASTDEREGSEIAMQVTQALAEASVRIVYVTHLFEFARTVRDSDWKRVLFLRADRSPDGSRTFRLVEGEPVETGFAEDLFRQVFGEPLGEAA